MYIHTLNFFACVGSNAKSISKWNLTGLNSEFYLF